MPADATLTFTSSVLRTAPPWRSLSVALQLDKQELRCRCRLRVHEKARYTYSLLLCFTSTLILVASPPSARQLQVLFPTKRRSSRQDERHIQIIPHTHNDDSPEFSPTAPQQAPQQRIPPPHIPRDTLNKTSTNRRPRRPRRNHHRL